MIETPFGNCNKIGQNWTQYVTFCRYFELIVREATKKTEKKLHKSCELSPKMENPPLPLFHNNFSRFRNLKIDVFCNY